MSVMTNEAIEGLAFLGIMGGMVSAIFLMAAVWYVLCIIANWRIFTKFGEPGWKSIVPFLNWYTMYQYTWNTRMFLVALGTAILIAVFSSFRGVMFAMLTMVLGIIYSVVNIMQIHRLSKAFGHGTGFTLGLIFLNNIFLLILGFGSDRYLGNPSGYDVDGGYERY